MQEQRDLQRSETENKNNLTAETELSNHLDSDEHFGEFQSCEVENSCDVKQETNSDEKIDSKHSKSDNNESCNETNANTELISEPTVKSSKTKDETQMSSDGTKSDCIDCGATGTDEKKTEDSKEIKAKQQTKEERLGMLIKRKISRQHKVFTRDRERMNTLTSQVYYEICYIFTRPIQFIPATN